MARFIHHTKRIISYPLQMGEKTIAINAQLWNTLFWETWNLLPLDQKLTWLAFVGQTIAILTLIEIVLLKK